jgi:5'-phosphate synthase pdxT subunit
LVGIIKIGILSVQGAVSEHQVSMYQMLKKNNINGEVTLVKQKKDINKINALIIPGGESSTIARILNKSDMYIIIKRRMQDDGFYIMGTCAGCVLLAKEIVGNDNKIELLKAMNMQVERNAFGRQKASFETAIQIKGFSKSYNAVFIRAPIIKKVWKNCEILAKLDEKIIAARQDNFLALSFHPEITNDLRIHELFLEMII